MKKRFQGPTPKRIVDQVLCRRGAVFSPCRTYRYVLWRIWNPDQPWALFIGLNPSTADEKFDDPTLRRCQAFAHRWGYGGVYMVNLFAFRAVDPRMLYKTPDPVGPDNDARIDSTAAEAGIVIAAWGNRGQHLDRATQVLPRLPAPHYLRPTKTGEPHHPLYLPADLTPKLYESD